MIGNHITGDNTATCRACRRSEAMKEQQGLAPGDYFEQRGWRESELMLAKYRTGAVLLCPKCHRKYNRAITLTGKHVGQLHEPQFTVLRLAVTRIEDYLTRVSNIHAKVERLAEQSPKESAAPVVRMFDALTEGGNPKDRTTLGWMLDVLKEAVGAKAGKADEGNAAKVVDLAQARQALFGNELNPSRDKPSLKQFKALARLRKQRALIDVIFADDITDERLAKLYETYLSSR